MVLPDIFVDELKKISVQGKVENSEGTCSCYMYGNLNQVYISLRPGAKYITVKFLKIKDHN